MKRVLSALLITLTILSFAVGCSDKNDPDGESQASIQNADTSSTNPYTEQLRLSLPHNVGIRFTDDKDTIIELDGLSINEEMMQNTETDADWYTSEDSVTINGFEFPAAVYTFKNDKINSLSYYLTDETAEYIYTKLNIYFTQIHGEAKERTDENNQQLYRYWEISDGDAVYTLELFMLSPESEDSEEDPMVFIGIYTGSF